MRLAFLTVLAIGLVPLLCIACASSTQQKIEVGAYESEQLLCVDQAATKADSQACRNAVKAKYGRLWTDAGTEAGDAK